jgi:alpha-beta hydrolase superfamily lysophospholipase
VGFSCPDLNQPAFRTLTITRMLDATQVAVEAAPAAPMALVGSSLGALVAVHAAATDRTGRVDRLVLLAPALAFGGNRMRQLGPAGIDAWRRTGRLDVFHHGDGVTRAVGFGLYEDARRYDPFALDVSSQPTLVIQGRGDETVDPAAVAQWAAGRPNVHLTVVDDGHELVASMPLIWAASARFFGLVGGERGDGDQEWRKTGDGRKR